MTEMKANPTEKRVTIFCGSSNLVDPVFFEKARELAVALAEDGWDLVYGGGTHGLMGEVAKTMKAHGRKVIGFIPEALLKRETGVIDEDMFGELHVVNTMHQRKLKMCEQSHAFIALPGGIGTLEELFEISTWNQLGIHDRPIVIYNVDNFYNKLLGFLDEVEKHAFMLPGHRRIIATASNPKECIEEIKNYTPVSDRYNLNWTAETVEI